MKKGSFILFIVFSLFITNTNAQFGGFGKALKNKAKEKVKETKKEANKKVNCATKEVENKLDTDEMSKECLRIKKKLDYWVKSAEKNLDNKNYKMATSRVRSLGYEIDKYNKKHCPLVNIYEDKKKELSRKVNLATIKDNPANVLVTASENNDKELVQMALDNGADINGINKKETALLAAIGNKNIEMIKFLVEKDANLNIGGFDKPLDRAIYVKSAEIFDYLMSKGADFEKSRNNPVLAASYKNQLEIVKLCAEKYNIDITVSEKNSNRCPSSRKTCALAYAKENSELANYISEKIKAKKAAKITDATHKKYINKIVFSTQKISANNANETSFSTKLIAVDKMYARIFLPAFVSEINYGESSAQPDLSHRDVSFYAQIEGNDKIISLAGHKDIADGKDYSTLDLSVNTSENFRVNFHRLFMLMKQGDNKVKFTLKIDLSGKNYEVSQNITLVKRAGDYYKVGKTFAQFKAGMRNANLEASLLKAARNMATNGSWKEKFRAVKISSSDWTILRNKLTGIITGRCISAYCLAKWPDGRCTVQEFTFKQEYTGSGYSRILKRYSTGSQKTIDCK